MTKPFDDLRRYADDLASEVSPFAAQRAVRSAMSPHVSRPRKVVVALVATGLLGISNVGLAASADSAVPGDVLYGVDQAYEQVVDLAGFGGPRVAERLQETSVLVERGELGVALDLVQKTLGKVLESDDPKAEFDTLVSETAGMPDVVASVVLEGLVGIARSISTDDEADGQAVAEFAKTLSDELSNRPDDAGPPEGGEG
ncbi:MAG: hypothetical protein WEA76_08355, partial [Acidimicrobiia bacterium]